MLCNNCFENGQEVNASLFKSGQYWCGNCYNLAFDKWELKKRANILKTKVEQQKAELMELRKLKESK